MKKERKKWHRLVAFSEDVEKELDGWFFLCHLWWHCFGLLSMAHWLYVSVHSLITNPI